MMFFAFESYELDNCKVEQPKRSNDPDFYVQSFQIRLVNRANILKRSGKYHDAEAIKKIDLLVY